MAEERKATDILLTLEEKINYLIQVYQNLDNNIKILSNKISTINTTSVQNIKPQLPSVSLPEGVKVPTATTSVELESPNYSSKKKEQKKVEIVAGAVRTTQAVFYPDGKRVVWAMVEISDTDDKQIAITKTNIGGRWERDLLPGEYKIRVSKPQPPIDFHYTITVKQTDGILELPAAKENVQT